MAISNYSSFNQDRDEIITGALELIEVVSPGEKADIDDIDTASKILNRLVKTLQVEGVHLWNAEWRTKTFFASNEVTGSDALVYTCIKTHIPTLDNQPVTGKNWSTYWKQEGDTGGVWAAGVKATLDAAVAVDAGSGNVDIPITGHSVLATDRIQLRGTNFYDGEHEVVSIPGANSVRIFAPYIAELFTGVETVDTVYTAIGDFILPKDIVGISNPFIRQNGSDNPVDMLDEIDYRSIYAKGAGGLTESLLFKYKIQPEVYLYPQPEEVTDVLHYVGYRRLKDFRTTDDEPDFPVHWVEPLINELAYKLTFVFGNTAEKRSSLFAEAQRLKGIALTFDKRTVIKDTHVIPNMANL